MDLPLLQRVLGTVAGIAGAIVAIMGILTRNNTPQNGNTEKKGIKKEIAIFFLIILILFALLSGYLEIVNRNKIYANLSIKIQKPRVVYENDPKVKEMYVKNANYKVVNSTFCFALDAQVQLKNVLTLEQYSFTISGFEYQHIINNIPSGEYDLTLITKEYGIFEERIILSRENLLSDGETWDYIAYIFDGFYDNAVNFNLQLGDIESIIIYPKFGINGTMIPGDSFYIFEPEINWRDHGKMSGTFWGYEDVYQVENCITNSKMDSLFISVKR